MSNLLTDKLELQEFLHIVVNICQISNSFSTLKVHNNEESKSEPSNSTPSKGIGMTSNQPEIFSIKTANQNKTREEIIQFIKNELQIAENELTIWNKMLLSISNLSMASAVQHDER